MHTSARKEGHWETVYCASDVVSRDDTQTVADGLKPGKECLRFLFFFSDKSYTRMTDECSQS